MSADKPLCVVHIGAPKTGSTALQKLWCEQRSDLLRQGWLYPEVSLRGWGHHDLAFLCSGGYPDWASPQPKDLATLSAELAAAVATYPGSVLLSSENFYLCGRPLGLKALLEASGLLTSHRLRLVVYLREQVSAHESWYNQTIKAQGYTHDVASCVQTFDALWDYEQQLSAWADAFGAEALLPRCYEESQYRGGSLAADFAHLLGLDVGAWTQSGAQINTSLNRDALEFQRLVNALPLTAQERRRFHKELIELSDRSRGATLFSEQPVIDAELCAALQQRYAAGNRAVARRFFNREQLFERQASRPATPPYAGLDQATQLRLMAWLLIRANPL